MYGLGRLSDQDPRLYRAHQHELGDKIASDLHYRESLYTILTRCNMANPPVGNLYDNCLEYLPDDHYLLGALG